MEAINEQNNEGEILSEIIRPIPTGQTPEPRGDNMEVSEESTGKCNSTCT